MLLGAFRVSDLQKGTIIVAAVGLRAVISLVFVDRQPLLPFRWRCHYIHPDPKNQLTILLE